MVMIKPSARHKARRFALQGLYQWHFTKKPADKIKAELMAENNMVKVDMVYFTAILSGTLADRQAIDEALSFLIERELEELDPVTLSALRLGAFELRERLDVPCQVIIDEAIKLTKVFGAEESYKFVNFVLDQAAKEWRPIETGSEIEPEQ